MVFFISLEMINKCFGWGIIGEIYRPSGIGYLFGITVIVEILIYIITHAKLIMK